ncbi:MAG TPA: hypothetical protein VG076_17845 [Acidimicrobiales bacterium]|nr:hypothetical protein [Acidimicrobiales bacterium]
MRRAVAIGLLMLGFLVAAASASVAQPVTPPPAPTTTSLAPTTSTSTRPKVARAGGGGSRLPTLGEGFPWITVGAVILVAGLAGARLRRASRR